MSNFRYVTRSDISALKNAVLVDGATAETKAKRDALTTAFIGYLTRKFPKAKLNSKCPCGSGKKFKKCCYYLNQNKDEPKIVFDHG